MNVGKFSIQAYSDKLRQELIGNRTQKIKGT